MFLLGVGIGSPWLVRDWMAARPVAVDSRPSTAPSVREPYPLANQTRRMVEGFLGAAGSLPPAEEVSPKRKAGIPETALSRSICRETALRLEPELSKLKLEVGDPVVLRLFKEEGELEIWMKPGTEPYYTLFKIGRIAEAAGREGPKLREGDGQAPEGFYRIVADSLRPDTKHHLGIDLGYPNAYDRHHGRTGSDLLLHGGGDAAGSYALAEQAMDEVYTLVEAALRSGQGEVPVHLFPFRLTDRRMDRVVNGGSRWTDGWVNLKEGYDFFDNVRLPPQVGVGDGRYTFRLEGSEI
ncbi:MAG TPA: 2-dehydro-3-deoxyphosphooctonate aldolase [Bacteroidia bacterium]|nr:2-dehydro-3-deoxyphosphooctonate aldolase [Bacteroidia bacterium]